MKRILRISKFKYLSAGVTVLAVVTCLTLISGEAWSASGWTSYGTAIELSPTASGRFLVKLDVASNPSSCTNKQWFYREYTGTDADYMFRTLLVAITYGKKVRVYVTGRCDIYGYSEISSASIIP